MDLAGVIGFFSGLVRLTGGEHWDICDSREGMESDTEVGRWSVKSRKARTAMCEMWVATRSAIVQCSDDKFSCRPNRHE